MKRLEINARVLTVKTDNPSTDWQEGARAGCVYGIQGQVVRVSDAHGLCYFVRHLWYDQNVDGWYDPDELVEVTDEDIAVLLQEAVAHRKAESVSEEGSRSIDRWDEVK